MGTLSTVRRWGRVHPRHVDAALAAALVVLTLLTLPGLSHGHGPDPGDLDDRGADALTALLLALAALPLVLRRRR